jgi:hypothetical protein
MKSSRFALLLAAAAVGCGRAAPPVESTFVAEWMQNHYGLIRAERISPPVASRVMAYSAVAIYQGIATNSKVLRSLVGQVNGLDSLPQPAPGSRIDPQLAALEAERTVLDTLYREGLPQTKAAIAALSDSLRSARVAQGISTTMETQSTEYGRRLGLAILAWAGRDGFDTTRTIPWKPPVGPQYWVNSSGADEYIPQNLSPARDFVAFDNPSASLKPGQASERALIVNRPKPTSITTVKAVNPTGATEPWWGTLRPFALATATECPIAPPAQYSADKTSDFYREAKATFDAGSNLDDEKHRIVLYWADNPGQSGTPVGHWLSIGSQMVAQRHLDAEQAAELFVLASMAQADAFIAAWEVKYQTMVIRPNTYINRIIDPKWQTDIITPPFPEYPSGHSVQSASAAAVMTALLGDEVAFDDSTNLALGHPVRRFGSFWKAAQEAAISRLYGGIHYPMAVDHGAELGRCIGEKVIARVKTRAPA